MTDEAQDYDEELSRIIKDASQLQREHLIHILHHAMMDMIAEGQPEEEVRAACAQLAERLGIPADQLPKLN